MSIPTDLLDTINRLRKDNQRLHSEVNRLKRALRKYGHHFDRCQYGGKMKCWSNPKRCDCGFAAALAGNE